jgi:hypothetical protein
MVSLRVIFHNISVTDLLHLSPASHFKTLYSEVPKLQHNRELCSRYSILLVSSLNLSPIDLWKESSFCWMPLLPWKPLIYFHIHLSVFVTGLPRGLKYSTFSYCFDLIIIFTVDECLEILITLVFFSHSFPFHNVFQLQLVYQSCSVVQFIP